MDKRITNRSIGWTESSIGGIDLLAAVQMNLDLDSRTPGVRYNPGANMPPGAFVAK